MLLSLKILLGDTVVAADGDIGKVHDFYFHDNTWIVQLPGGGHGPLAAGTQNADHGERLGETEL